MDLASPPFVEERLIGNMFSAHAAENVAADTDKAILRIEIVEGGGVRHVEAIED